jgi:hypothetical protein
VVDSIDNIALTVVGGSPTALDVSVDFGQQGDRGSRIFAGPGDPNTYAPSSIQLYDWYINTNTTETYYSWMYQYTLVSTSPTWVPILKLNPSQYSTIATSTFTTGSTTIAVPVKNLTTNSTVAASDFIIRYSIKNANPVSSGFTYSITGTYPNQNISIVINGVSYNGSTWSNLTGSQDVHLFISYKG